MTTSLVSLCKWSNTHISSSSDFFWFLFFQSSEHRLHSASPSLQVTPNSTIHSLGPPTHPRIADLWGAAQVEAHQVCTCLWLRIQVLLLQTDGLMGLDRRDVAENKDKGCLTAYPVISIQSVFGHYRIWHIMDITAKLFCITKVYVFVLPQIKVKGVCIY